MLPGVKDSGVGRRLTPGMFSSLRGDWETPDQLFYFLDKEFHFDLDVCATRENTKCANFISPEQDALSFGGVWVGVCWCNPPYGNELAKWLWRAHESAKAGSTVVCLIPARTDTSWWHETVMPFAAEIRFLRGRLSFDNRRRGRCPFPSAIVVFRPGRKCSACGGTGQHPGFPDGCPACSKKGKSQ